MTSNQDPPQHPVVRNSLLGAALWIVVALTGVAVALIASVVSRMIAE